jgi:hypothetical protein
MRKLQPLGSPTEVYQYCFERFRTENGGIRRLTVLTIDVIMLACRYDSTAADVQCAVCSVQSA